MAYRKNKNDEPRTLGRQTNHNHEGKRQALMDVAMAYCLYSIRNDIPCYVGTPTTTGGIRLKFYADGDSAQVYISTTDNFRDEMPDQLSDLTGKETSWDELCRMAPQLAAAVAELAKRGPAREEPVSIPQRPQRPAQ